MTYNLCHSYLVKRRSCNSVVVMDTKGKKDTHTALLYELAFTVTGSVSGQSCQVKQSRARSVAGWVTQALEQGRLGSCTHAGYHQYNGVRSVWKLMQGQLWLLKEKRREWCSGNGYHRYKRLTYSLAVWASFYSNVKCVRPKLLS